MSMWHPVWEFILYVASALSSLVFYQLPSSQKREGDGATADPEKAVPPTRQMSNRMTRDSGIIRLPATASCDVDMSFEIDMRDHKDHSFSGIVFDIVAKKSLPLEYLEISSVKVRGELGPLTVYAIRGGHEGNEEEKMKR